jgi:hypothetical protein
MADTSYVVTGKGAYVDVEGGGTVFLTNGAPVPSNADADHLEHLLNVGLIGKGDALAGVQPTVLGDGSPIPDPPKPAPRAGK